MYILLNTVVERLPIVSSPLILCPQGYGDKEGQYIATQGPTANTLADFWRMVWEKDVSILVMTTSLVENGTVRDSPNSPTSCYISN